MKTGGRRSPVGVGSQRKVRLTMVLWCVSLIIIKDPLRPFVFYFLQINDMVYTWRGWVMVAGDYLVWL